MTKLHNYFELFSINIIFVSWISELTPISILLFQLWRAKTTNNIVVKRNVARNLRKGKDVKNAQEEIKFLKTKSDFFLIFE